MFAIEDYFNYPKLSPFFLGRAFQYLLLKLPTKHEIVGCVLLDASPFGKRESMLRKLIKTIRVFSIFFLFGYAYYFAKGFLKGTPSVRSVLKRSHIPILKIKGSISSKASMDCIRCYKPDLLISVAGNQIFKEQLINLAPYGCLNLHTALLPKYRGLMPTFWVLLNDEKETGVSVFFVDEGIDSGPILIQKRYMIFPEDSQQKLIEKTKRIGMEALIESINLIDSGNISTTPNPVTEMTYFSFPKAKDVTEFKRRGKKFF